MAGAARLLGTQERRRSMSTRALRDFVVEMTSLAEKVLPEPELLEAATPLILALIARDGWLPARFSEESAERYRQYLLYCDPLERFSLVSFVWGPGQATPVHDHTVWGAIGVLRGAERCQRYECDDGVWHPSGEAVMLERGAVDFVSPTIGDVHKVANAQAARVSVSVHLYGGNIGRIRRHAFGDDGGTSKEFVSGYSSDVLPNIWA
jgi:predicted metal-dependent enzyme (double-stranded beta helix superfamily)